MKHNTIGIHSQLTNTLHYIMKTESNFIEKLCPNYKLVALSCLIFAGTLPSLADQLTPSEAIARMQNSKGMRKAAGNKRYALKHTIAKGDTALVYLMSAGDNSGIYLLSADDCAPAVLGWTEGGDADSIPDAVKWWVSQYSEVVSDAIENERSVRKVAANSDVVTPMLTTSWGQSKPYNILCKDVMSGVKTGCVATAMAQIMNYYEYPSVGTGSHSYTCKGKPVSSNFAEHTYQWDKMLNVYESTGNGTEEENAVAQLMRDCGISCDMYYSLSSSTAYNTALSQALPTYFGYDKGIHNIFRSDMSDEEWTNTLINELKEGRPVYYTGYSSNKGGHAFVCDGYSGDGYFHFNWGWDGKYNGYFLITGSDALNAYGTLYPGDSYCENQMMTIGIQPERTLVDNVGSAPAPKAQVSSMPFAHNDGVRNINNKVTQDGLTVRFEMDALEDVNDLTISCAVFSTETNMKVAECESAFSAKEGEKVVVDLKPVCQARSIGLNEGAYEIQLSSDNNSTIIPEEYNNIPVVVVDHMPTISDLPKKIQMLQEGGCTKKDIEDTVFEILNTTKITK